jgi:hypothetical protein
VLVTPLALQEKNFHKPKRFGVTQILEYPQIQKRVEKKVIPANPKDLESHSLALQGKKKEKGRDYAYREDHHNGRAKSTKGWEESRGKGV